MPAIAFGHAAAVSEPALVSGASPFMDCPVDPDPPPLFDGQAHDLELEPAVAVNPTDAKNVVAAWLQGENLGVVAASSFDGGKSWDRTIVPEITRCSGGLLDIAFNPSLSFGPDGTVYLIAMASGGYFPDPRGALTRVMVARSTDGGVSWTTTAIPASDADNDFPTIAAEPDDPGAAVAVWAKKTVPASDTTMFSRTSDGGRTWTVPRVAATTDPDRLALNQVRALGGDSFAIARIDFPLTGATSSDSNLRLFSSADGGETWSPAAAFPGATDVSPATSGKRDLHLAVITPSDGGRKVTAYSSYDAAATFGTGRVITSLPNEGSPPSLAVDGQKTLALAVLDGSPTGQLRLFHEHGNSGTWDPGRVAVQTTLPPDVPPFYATPRIDGSRGGFVIVSLLGEDQAEHGATDVFFSRLPTPDGGNPR